MKKAIIIATVAVAAVSVVAVVVAAQRAALSKVFADMNIDNEEA
jgi:hypothetical protein